MVGDRGGFRAWARRYGLVSLRIVARARWPSSSWSSRRNNSRLYHGRMPVRVDGRRVRGDRTRKRTARSAADLATLYGLESLNVSELARVTGFSKSGILTVFENREAIQRAALDEARLIVLEHVIEPAWEITPGSARLAATVANWFEYVRTRVFPGGCFMAALASEYAGQTGPTATLARASKLSWLRFIEGELRQGASAGNRTEEEIATAVLTLDGIMLAANTHFLLLDDAAAIDLGQRACEDLLSRW